MFYDAESRSILARERNELLQAGFSESDHRARRWLSARLIAAGERLAPRKCESVPGRSTNRTRAAY